MTNIGYMVCAHLRKSLSKVELTALDYTHIHAYRSCLSIPIHGTFTISRAIEVIKNEI